MNSKSKQSQLEKQDQHQITTFFPSSKPNSKNPPKMSKAKLVSSPLKQETNQNPLGSKTVQVPFKSLISDANQPLITTAFSKSKDKTTTNISINPFSTIINAKKPPEIERLNVDNINITEEKIIEDNKKNEQIEKYFSKEKSPNISKPVNNGTRSTIKIQLVKSQNKPKGRLSSTGKISFDVEKNNNYKLLVKKIATKLKNIIRPPTHGFFYTYIEKEKKYKLLIKKIALQLKKRIKFPTCKIIKIYESYIILIKRIASLLNKGTKKNSFATTSDNTQVTQIATEDKQISNSKNFNNQINNINRIAEKSSQKIDAIIKSGSAIEKIEIEEEIPQISNCDITNNKDSILNDNDIKELNDVSFNSNKKMFNPQKIAKTEKISKKILKEGREVQSVPGSSKHSKNINVELPVFKKDDKHDLNVSQDLNVSLSKLNKSNSNFVHDFQRFLNKMNIKIENNFPVSINEKNSLYFKQSNFWLLVINYLFDLNNNISIYTIISLLEQYYIWCTDKNVENFNVIKESIVQYIEENYTNDEINQFLFMNKLKNIGQIFEKFEKGLQNATPTKYTEIKINEIVFEGKPKESKCHCELCENDDACVKKVYDLNKNKINISNNITMDFIGVKEEKAKPEEENDKKAIDHILTNNEEIFYKGYSKKKQAIFSQSKTVFDDNVNLQFPKIEKIPQPEMEEPKKEQEDKDEKKNGEDDNKEKDYKTKSKKSKKVNEDLFKDEEKEEENEEKNKKKTKKAKKTKNKNKDKKKRDSIKSEDEDEKEEEIDVEKSRKKKKSEKKTRKNKSEDNKDEEKEEKVDSDDEKKSNGKHDSANEEDEPKVENSKRKKSKTPNKRKNKKH